MLPGPSPKGPHVSPSVPGARRRYGPYLLDQEGLLHDLGAEAPQALDSLVLALAGFELLRGAQCVLQQHQPHPEDDLDACTGWGGSECTGAFREFLWK